MSPLVCVKNVKFTYKSSDTLIVNDFSLEMRTGQWLGLTGPSGCGKSTLGRIIAGHLRPAHGKILIAGRDVTGIPNRQVIMLQQESDLFPWLTVEKHLEHVGCRNGTERSRWLAFAKLKGAEKSFPYQLSGGMKKRLSLARALAVSPALLIFDETFNSLDDKLKQSIFADLKEIKVKNHTAVLMISHDIKELSMLTEHQISLA